MSLSVTIHKANPQAVRITDTTTGKQIYIRVGRFTTGQSRLVLDGDEQFQIDRVHESTLTLDETNGSVVSCSVERIGQGKRERAVQ